MIRQRKSFPFSIRISLKVILLLYYLVISVATFLEFFNIYIHDIDFKNIYLFTLNYILL